MTDTLSFEGRAAIVTGAGRGLGRTYALELAKRGANVLVNDLGCEATGEGQGESVADLVVNEIASFGGKAIANSADVSNPDSVQNMVDQTVSEFGRIDIVINNAGYGIGELFANLPIEKYQHMDAVNHLGSMYVAKAAWPHMAKQKYGRIIMTSSPAGVWGRLGISAYSASKSAVLMLGRVLAQEGAEKNIKVNSVAPLAYSRLSNMFDTDLGRRVVRPELVAALVVALAHESCPVTGEAFKAAAGRFSCVKTIESRGVAFDPREELSAEQLSGRFQEICDMEGGAVYDTSAQAFVAGFQSLEGVIGDDAKRLLDSAIASLKSYG